MKRILDLVIVILCLALVLIMWNEPAVMGAGIWIVAFIIIGLIHLFLAIASGRKKEKSESILQDIGSRVPGEACTELVLLSEEGTHLARWNIYGKNGIVIGRDVGENHVTVDLNETTYASMVDVEHAVLNFSGNDWYIEDVSSKNGVSIQKRDGKKYKISYGKPCKIEQFDILFIGLTRLQII